MAVMNWMEKCAALAGAFREAAARAQRAESVEALLEALAEQGTTLWGATQAVVLFLDPGTQNLVSRGSGGAEETFGLTPGQGLMMALQEKGQPLCVGRNDGWPLTPAEKDFWAHFAADYWLAVPVVEEDGLLGVLNLFRTEPWTEGEILLAALWAERATGLVREHRMQQALRTLQTAQERQTLEINALREISAAIRSIPRLQQTLEELVISVGFTLDADKCVFLLHEPATDELVAQQPVLGLTDEEVARLRLPASVGISGRVFRTGEAVMVADVHADPQLGPERELALALGVTSLLSAPLQVENQTLGVINVFNKRSGQPFTPEDQALLRTLASQAAVILQNSRLHAAVEAERKMLEAILDSLGSAAVVLDREERILLCNPVAEDQFQIREEAVLGQPVATAFRDHPDIVALLTAPPTEPPAQGTDPPPPLPELKLPGPEEIVLQVRTTNLRGPQGKVLGRVAVFNDITQIRKVDQLKTEFVSTVSHELRTPLTTIKAFTATLLRDVEFDRATQVEWLTIIDSECNRLTRLINDLLSISRIEAGRSLQMNWEEIDLAEIVHRVVEQQSSYTTRHQLKPETPKTLVIEADEDKIIQILTNLVNNAIKYAPRGGLVEVKAMDNGRYVHVSVKDEGPGIRPEHLTKVFDKFYQADSSSTRRVGGTGLGLYLTKHLVEAHGGKIWAESEWGHGATFHFVLPKRRHVSHGSP